MQADNLTKNASGREGMEDVNSALEPHHGTATIALEFVEILGWLPKDVNDRVGIRKPPPW